LSVLERILAKKRSELDELRRRKLPTPGALRPVRLRRAETGRLSLITEIKRRSPSAGVLSTKLGVAERARAYETHGASMISVLCDQQFFDGSYEHLIEARAVTTVPLLCKEFILDECQLDAARAYGADAALLIVRCLDPEQLASLVVAAKERGLTPLVEIYSLEEANVAIDAGAEYIGVNVRDLDTLQMSAERAREVTQALPQSACRLHFSGVRTASDVTKISSSGVDAALVGEVLMRQDDPGPTLTELARAAQGPD
jgi:indole-3-glycerol phosphate synthase